MELPRYRYSSAHDPRPVRIQVRRYAKGLEGPEGGRLHRHAVVQSQIRHLWAVKSKSTQLENSVRVPTAETCAEGFAARPRARPTRRRKTAAQAVKASSVR